MTLKKQVVIALVKKDWSQRELARQMGITMSYLADILKGNRKAEKRLSQIEELLEIEIKREVKS